MTPIIAASFEPNGSAVIAISVPNRRTSNSSAIKTTTIATLKEKLLSRRYKKRRFFPFFPPPKFQLPDLDYIPDGTISLIRFIRSDRKLDVFGEDFEVPKELVYTYVRAKIITQLHQIQVSLGEELVTTFEYQLPPWLSLNP